jgi:hypothetical protein
MATRGELTGAPLVVGPSAHGLRGIVPIRGGEGQRPVSDQVLKGRRGWGLQADVSSFATEPAVTNF